jgi:hypothetical protein
MSISLLDELTRSDLRFDSEYVIKTSAMEKIDPQHDHLQLEQYCPGQQVIFQGKTYTVQRRTTLASGEAAVVLQGDKEQFVVSANQFLAGVK